MAMRNRAFKALMERYERKKVITCIWGDWAVYYLLLLLSFLSIFYLCIYSFFFLFLHSFSLLKFCHRSPFNKSKSKSTDHDDIFNAQNTRNTGYVPPLISTGPSKQIHDEKPTGITEGWLEKKKSSKMFSMGPEWQKR